MGRQGHLILFASWKGQPSKISSERCFWALFFVSRCALSVAGGVMTPQKGAQHCWYFGLDDSFVGAYAH